ncbi:hypothetical protein HDV02_000111 [Globomyces sp. JEL0801]|nr:hypothetical protein HDV02_000111 [Globomyces sp. JEL0801]
MVYSSSTKHHESSSSRSQSLAGIRSQRLPHTSKSVDIPNYAPCPADWNSFPLTCSTKGCGGYWNYSWGAVGCHSGARRKSGIWGYHDCYKSWIVDCFRWPIRTISRKATCPNDGQVNIAGLCYGPCDKEGLEECLIEAGVGAAVSAVTCAVSGAASMGVTCAVGGLSILIDNIMCVKENC